jgi:hypothetical protein
MLNVEAIGKMFDMMVGPMHDPAMVAIAPVWQKTRIVLAGATLDKGISIHAIGETASPEDSKKVARTLQALATLAENFMEGSSSQIDQIPPTERAVVGQVLAIGKDLLAHVKVTSEGSSVEVQASSEKLTLNTITQLVLPAITEARQSAQRSRSVNNLKQIALAMHNYHDANGHFPSAVLLGPDGKTTHSWRVALLPYLEQNELYKAYKFNEPWDSPSNKKVLEKMPSVYSALPSQGGTSSSYYVFSGEDTAFPGDRAIKLTHITDGTSNTIMAVEAKRNIPWTKPEDLKFELKKPIARPGGFFPGGFNAALCDGSVRFIPSSIADPILRALITRGGGEVLPNF